MTPWVFGKWFPAVRTSNGFVPIYETVQIHEVPSVLTSMTPEVLNPGGNDVMTVIGENFPSNLEDFPGFYLTWNDGTRCIILTSSPTMVTCRNQRFSDAVINEVRERSESGRRDLQFSNIATLGLGSMMT